MITPCMDCTDRFPGCHAQCGRYDAYRKSYDKIVAAAKAYTSHEADSVLINTSLRVNKKFHRTRRR